MRVSETNQLVEPRIVIPVAPKGRLRTHRFEPRLAPLFVKNPVKTGLNNLQNHLVVIRSPSTGALVPHYRATLVTSHQTQSFQYLILKPCLPNVELQPHFVQQ